MKPFLEKRFNYEFLHIHPSTHVNYYVDYGTTFAKLAFRIARAGYDGVLVWNYYYVPVLAALERARKIVDVTDVERSITHARRLKGMAVDIVEKRMMSGMDLLICADHGNYLDYSQRFKEVKVRYVPNGVDLEAFKPQGQIPKEYDSCYLGKVERQYSLEPLIKAVAKTGTRSLFIGRGTDSAYYEDMARKEGARITFHGYANYEDVPGLLNSARMGLVPPVMSGSLKLLEYMACGLPVASPGKLDPSIQGGVMTIQQGTPEEYATAIQRIAGMAEDEYHRMSEKCRVMALGFSIESVAKRYCDAIEEVLEG